mmetsp:Transcript_62901/g.115709  ORF Transcript_62901/g.115709 Transcript_62901/m.115709 type:complete len:231 (-) Transcript_62901:474-1166(-)
MLLALVQVARAKLRQGALLGLQHGRQVLVRGTSNIRAFDDGDGLLNCLHLLHSKLLTRLEVTGLHLTCCHQIRIVLFISRFGSSKIRQITLSIGLLLELRGFVLGLLSPHLCRMCNLVRQLLHEQLEGLDGLHLGLLSVCALIHELVLKLRQHINDGLTLKFVRVGFRRSVVKALWFSTKRQELIDGVLGVVGDEIQALQVAQLHERSLLHVRSPCLEHFDGACARIDRL